MGAWLGYLYSKKDPDDLSPLQEACLHIYYMNQRNLRLAETNMVTLACLGSKEVQGAADQYFALMFPGQEAGQDRWVREATALLDSFEGKAFKIDPRTMTMTTVEAEEAHEGQRQRLELKKKALERQRGIFRRKLQRR